ncbi:AAA family ATPase [Stenotrophomonas acidaminiphila]|uniref:AAA family ATPase n=1 Tax=Stenotrophomonas acidaminiphila TaxID=128780 RepID=UPI0028AA7A82|nr:AAA family ATPase [Stenotrophomonas acidaminiphila]
MKLISLKIISRGIRGWESPELLFGDRTTSLYAPNGSGKTPLLQALAFSLGFSSKFREDIREHCESTELSFEFNSNIYTIKRKLTSDFNAELICKERSYKFFSEGELSKALFDLFSMPPPVLISASRLPASPYVSTILPIFYVRQDGGYIDPYSPPAKFISDQFVEMIRFAFGLPPKRSYNSQKELIKAKESLESIQRRLVLQQNLILEASASVDDSPINEEKLRNKSTQLAKQVEELRESVDTNGAADNALIELLQSKEEQIRSTRRQYNDLRLRLIGIESIRSEIKGEIATLSLNEESKRVFESFLDICNRSDCGLFATSAQSYAKNLVYLKDQIKDIETNARKAELQISILEQNLIDQERERALISSKMKQPENQNITSQLISAVQSITKELVETEQELAAIKRLNDLKVKYVNLSNDRSHIQDSIANLTNSARSDLQFSQIKQQIRELTVKWMDVLNTPNASRQVNIDADFKISFGNETIDVFTGSTRNRLILAIHAAIFEEYLSVASRPFRFLILDTPKQNELSSEDLSNFLHKLQDVCDKKGGQIIISATEYHHDIGANDREWRPQYQGAKQPMYLGPPHETPQPTF